MSTHPAYTSTYRSIWGLPGANLFTWYAWPAFQGLTSFFSCKWPNFGPIKNRSLENRCVCVCVCLQSKVPTPEVQDPWPHVPARHRYRLGCVTTQVDITPHDLPTPIPTTTFSNPALPPTSCTTHLRTKKHRQGEIKLSIPCLPLQSTANLLALV